MLTPVVPALLDCSARAVYVPFANGLVGATAQLPPEAVVASVCTGEPETPDPEKTLTVIFDESPGAVPAAPENAGLFSCVVLPLTGLLTVTAGGTATYGPRYVGGGQIRRARGADRAHVEGVRSIDKRGVPSAGSCTGATAHRQGCIRTCWHQSSKRSE